MLLNKRSGIPLYYQIQESIIDKITRGDLKPGDSLPPISDLCEIFGVSHITVNKALSKLKEQGFIDQIQGKGTYVSTLRKFDQQFLKLSSFTDDVSKSNLEPSTEIIHKGIIPASENIAASLKIPLGAEIAYLERLRKANNEPMQIDRSFLNHKMCPGILNFDLEKKSLYYVLTSEFGIKLSKSIISFEAILLRQDEADLFKLKSFLPAFLTSIIVQTSSGEIIEFTKQILRGDRYRLIGEVDGYKNYESNLKL